MFTLIKKYWDIISGILAGIILTIIADFELETVQLYYSIIILMLVSVGILRIIKQEIEKRLQRKERKHNVIDSIVDSQQSVKAIRLAEKPMQDGEKMGNLIIKLWEEIKNIMEKLKTFFKKFKGVILTIALAILSLVETCGGFINELCGGVLVIKGIPVIPVVTIIATTVVGILSNTFTPEQMEKIKALFSKSTMNQLLKDEIKKTLKEKTTKLSEENKALVTKENELSNLNGELEKFKNTLSAKREMYSMTPQLATNEDVQRALKTVEDCNLSIRQKNFEIEESKRIIETLTSTINSLHEKIKQID